MASFILQTSDGSALRSFSFYHDECPQFWDPVNARFQSCFLRYLTIVPGAVAALISLFLLAKLTPWRLKRPKWLAPFVQETMPGLGEDPLKDTRSMNPFALSLLIASIIGFAIQILNAVMQSLRMQTVVLVAPWIIACLIIAITRPYTAPKPLLLLYGVILVTQSIALMGTLPQMGTADIPLILAPLLALVGIAIILHMPGQRHPRIGQIGTVDVPPSSALRSPEDDITLWSFMTVSWMSPLISLANRRQLNDDDVWSLSYEFQHKPLHQNFRELRGSVLRRLFSATGIDLVLISLLSIIELMSKYSIPALLQKILQSMENPNAPVSAALTYTVLSLVMRLIASQSAVFSLWYGRRAYERSRGAMITMLYEKTLSRKVVSLSTKARETKGNQGDLVLGRQHNDTASNGICKSENRGLWRRIFRFAKRPFPLGEIKSPAAEDAGDAEDLASMGKIINLMRYDAYEVAQRFWEFSSLITQPLGLVLSVVLIWQIIGWSCLIGMFTIIIAQIFNAFIAKALLGWERERRVATDTKIHKISQLVESIRHLRWYGWQDVWLDDIFAARKRELRLRVITSLLRTLINWILVFANAMFPVVAFYAYTTLAGLPLRVDIAFPALQLFNMLDNNLRELPNLITVLLNAKVAVDRIEGFMQEPNKEEQPFRMADEGQIETKHAHFAWPGAPEPVLKDITVSFPKGLTVIFGEVGAGKTALLLSLLGECDLLSGEYHRSSDVVGFCGQTPWLQSMSIRDNILFSAPYEETRYKQVLEACALIPDLLLFKHGDLSMIGENGIGLSGGQRARVALARAIYSQSKTLLLDDPLSALDHQTAEYIVRRCIAGPLLEDRTIVLVTHRIELCLSFAKQVIQISNGCASVLSPTDELPFEELHRVRSSDLANEVQQNQTPQDNVVPEKFLEDEHRAQGGVQARVYWEYIKAGKLKWWAIVVGANAVYRATDFWRTWFLKQWGEAYNEQSSSGFFDNMPSPEENIRPWLAGFLAIAATASVVYFIILLLTLVIIYKAGKEMFERVMKMVTHSTFRFYDITPVGRLMNRLTSDINTIDGPISDQFQTCALLIIAWIFSLIIIGSVTPIFLIFALALSLTFVLIFRHFLPTSQSLRRLEMVSLSPLLSNFGTLADGLTTVRAFCAQARFQDRVIAVTDNFQKMDHFYWSLQAWLMYRFDALSALSTFLLTLLALYTNVSPGMTAFVLTAAGRFVSSTHRLCKQYGKLQMDFVSVERIVELLHLEQEPVGKIDPPAYWPRLGSSIVFEDVTIKYAPHLDPALQGINLEIKGGSTTALIGRTGSGKSTLALSLLATTLPTNGRILIDSLDIATLNTQTLRQRITFLAQDPVLFPGTLLLNLDPLNEYTSDECATVLSKIAGDFNWTLDMNIDTGGRNLSQGQRQLVGLARALLRRSAVVVLDEATASVDSETAGKVLKVLREELKGSTVLVVAHRVEAVKDVEAFVELGKGKVLSAGPVRSGEEN